MEFNKNTKTTEEKQLDISEKNKLYLEKIYKLWLKEDKQNKKKEILEKNINKEQLSNTQKIFEKTLEISKKQYKEDFSKILEHSSEMLNKTLGNDFSKGVLKSFLIKSNPFGPLIGMLDDEFEIFDKTLEKTKNSFENLSKKLKDDGSKNSVNNNVGDILDEINVEKKSYIKKIEDFFSKNIQRTFLGKVFIKTKNGIYDLAEKIEKMLKIEQDNKDDKKIEDQKQKILQDKQNDILEKLTGTLDDLTDKGINANIDVKNEKEGGFFSKIFERIFGKKSFLKPIINFLGKLIPGFMKDFFKSFGKNIFSFFGKIFSKEGLISKLLSPILGIFGKGGGFLGKALGFGGKFLKVLGPIGMIASAGISAFNGYKNAGNYFGKKQKDTTTKEKISATVGGLVEGLSFGLLDGKMVAHVTKFFLDIGEKVIKELYSLGKKVISFVWDGIKNIFSKIFNFYKKLWTPIFKWLGEIFSDIINGIKKAFEWYLKIWKTYFNIWKTIWKFIFNIFLKIGKFFKNIFGDIISSIGEFFSNIWTNIKKAFKWYFNIWKTIGKLFENLFSIIWSGIKKAFEWYLGIWKIIGKKVYSIFKPIIDWFAKLFDPAINALKSVIQWISNKFNSIKKNLLGIIDWIAKKFQNSFKWLIDLYNKLMGAKNWTENKVKDAKNWVVDKSKKTWDGVKSFFGFGEDKKDLKNKQNIDKINQRYNNIHYIPNTNPTSDISRKNFEAVYSKPKDNFKTNYQKVINIEKEKNKNQKVEVSIPDQKIIVEQPPIIVNEEKKTINNRYLLSEGEF